MEAKEVLTRERESERETREQTKPIKCPVASTLFVDLKSDKMWAYSQHVERGFDIINWGNKVRK